jgi:hypothetical protein
MEEARGASFVAVPGLIKSGVNKTQIISKLAGVVPGARRKYQFKLKVKIKNYAGE